MTPRDQLTSSTSTGSAAPAGTDFQVARLVMAATTLWQWNAPEKQAARLRSLLLHLLDSRRPGQAWLQHDLTGTAPGSAAATTSFSDFDDVEAALRGIFDAPGDSAARDPAWTDGCAARYHARRVARHLGQFRARSDGSTSLEERLAQINEARCRVFMDAARFNASSAAPSDQAELAGTGADNDFYVSFDLRHDLLLGRQFTVVTIAAWSHWPHSRSHSPHNLGPAVTPVSTALRTTFHDYVRPAAIRLLQRMGLESAVLRVRDEPYVPPVFWVVVPLRTLPEHSLDLFMPVVRPSVQMFLLAEGPSDCAISSSVLTGDVLTLRRMLPIGTGASMPVYLLIPSFAPTATGERDDELAAQEEKLATVVRSLSEMETHAATHLLTENVNLQIIQNHLVVYEASATHAAQLWDAVALHLPVRRGRRLGRVHRIISLLHQVMLQSVADIDDLVRGATASETKLSETAEKLKEGFDRHLTEEHLVGRPEGLRASITRTGLLLEAVAQASETARHAERVGMFHRNLLAAITAAFDERRARELDGLQKSNFIISLAVAVIGVVTVLDAVATLRPSGRPTENSIVLGPLSFVVSTSALTATSWAIGLLLVSVLVIVGLSWSFSYGVITTYRFRRTYRRLSAFLRAVSTAELERMLDEHKAGDPSAVVADLARHDEKLAREFAWVFDRLSAWPVERRSPWVGADIVRLRRSTERWALESLLLTERPWALLRYRLPLLTCMYRWASRHETCLLQGTGHNVVHDVDFLQSMLRVQLPDEADGEVGVPAHRRVSRRAGVDLLDDFLRPRAGVTARQMLTELLEKGLSPSMSPTEFEKLLSQLPTRV